VGRGRDGQTLFHLEVNSLGKRISSAQIKEIENRTMGFCRLATLATPGAGEHHSHIRRKIDAAIPQLLFSLGLWLLESFCGLTLFGTAELYKSNDWQ
jgi:hypothetical protein